MKKKPSLSHLKKSWTTLIAGMMLSTNAWAAGDVMTLIDYLQKVVNAVAESVAGYIYEFNPLLPKTISANIKAPKVQEAAQNYTNALTVCQIYIALPRHNKASKPDVPKEFESLNTSKKGNLDEFCESITQQIAGREDRDKFKVEQSKLPGTDTELPQSITLLRNKSQAASNTSFNFESFIVPSLYKTPEEQNSALNFITFSSRTYEPFPADLGAWRQAFASNSLQKPNLAFINYQMAVRSYVTAQSVAVGNLYRMIADRTEQPEIVKLNLTDQDGVEIKSPLQYQEYMANRRTNSQDWYTTMNSASANTVSREMVFILAEMQRSLHRIEKTNERLLATFSVMELINLYSTTRPELKALAPLLKQSQQ